MLSFCLIFCQIQSGVAYKSVAYKKSVYLKTVHRLPSEINTTPVDNVKDLDVVMPMYTLMKHSNNYLKTWERVWQYCREEPDNNITDSESFKFKSRFLDKTDNTSAVNI